MGVGVTRVTAYINVACSPKVPERDEHRGCGDSLGTPHLALGNQTGVRGAACLPGPHDGDQRGELTS
jgi:hypothetical protein